MKKTLTTLAAFCFGIFISFSIIACADDFGNNDQVDKDEELQTLREMVAKLSEKVEALQSRVTVIEDDVTLTSFHKNNSTYAESLDYSCQYDDMGRVSTITYKDGEGNGSSYSVSYSENKCTIKGGNTTYTITTKNNNNNAVNRLIWSMITSFY